MCRLRYVTMIMVCLLCHTAQGQLRWIADARFNNSTIPTLYSLCENDKPVVLAVGNIHSRSTELLLESHMLQKLSREHNAIAGNGLSMKDLNVVFLNVKVIEGEAAGQHESFPVINIDESDEALNQPGWESIYSITSTGLFLITPDHLVYSLKGGSAADVYDEVKKLVTLVKPVTTADVRILDVVASGDGKAAVTVQNFSKSPLQQMRIAAMQGGKEIASMDYGSKLGPLDATTIEMPLADPGMATIEIVAIVKGDGNPSNNIWTGRLSPATDRSLVAGTSSR